MKKPEIYLEPKSRALKVIELLEREHPDAKVALHYTNPLELLVATILSAQCTDERVNIVTRVLFKKYTKAEDYANVNLKEMEQDIRPTSFYRNKAKNLKKCCQLLVEKYHSQVPRTMEELLELPGVARKTANIVLSNAYGFIEGVAVDTHVRRLAQRLGLTESDDPAKIEVDLMHAFRRLSSLPINCFQLHSDHIWLSILHAYCVFNLMACSTIASTSFAGLKTSTISMVFWISSGISRRLL